MQIPFIESYWRIGSIDGPVASISDLINVLADVNDFRFTGKFGSVRLQNADCYRNKIINNHYSRV